MIDWDNLPEQVDNRDLAESAGISVMELQKQMAENFLSEIFMHLPHLAEENELDTLMILDALGCAGLSLCVCDDASKAYFSNFMELAD